MRGFIPMSEKVLCENRKARFHYEIIETLEAGMILTGSEVKSLRAGGGNLNDAYAIVRGGSAELLNSHIAPYAQASYNNHEPLRTRKLLLHRSEIDKLIGVTQHKGIALIPLKMYFKKGVAKVLLGLGKGKKTIDKRQTIKKREADRAISRTLKNARR